MSREHSVIIKGIGILLMLICHLFFVAESTGNVFWDILGTASHMVNFFLIVSGYGLYLVYSNNNLNWKYLTKRTLRLYLSLWLVLLIFPVLLGFLLYPGRFSCTWYSIVTNFCAWRWDYCNFTWFFLPYVLMTFCSKPIFRLIDYCGNATSFVLGALVYVGSTWLISRFYLSYLNDHYVVYHVVLLAQTLFGLILGAILARLSLQGKSLEFPCFRGRSWLVVLILIVVYFLRGLIHSAVLNPFFALFVAICVINIEWSRPIAKFFTLLGNQSMMMWLVQGFLGVVMFKEYYEPLHWPILVYIVWGIITYVVACILTPVSNRLAKALKLS